MSMGALPPEYMDQLHHMPSTSGLGGGHVRPMGEVPIVRNTWEGDTDEEDD